MCNCVGQVAQELDLTETAVRAWVRQDTIDGTRGPQGRELIGAFLASVAFRDGRTYRLVETRANGQLAFGEYRWNEPAGGFVGEAVMVLTLADSLIADITAFRGRELFVGFGLPERLAQ